MADNMEGYDIGQIVNLDKVLLVGSKTATLVGKPLVSGANVSLICKFTLYQPVPKFSYILRNWALQ